jgi:hypothetical protein
MEIEPGLLSLAFVNQALLPRPIFQTDQALAEVLCHLAATTTTILFSLLTGFPAQADVLPKVGSVGRVSC